ncbi:hypothetical protein [Paenibacillus sp. YIM B09110]|uniref:hypothetical protein n=1 Tax=Paenibacillus sp. YIM B09110 TaxID=3126102 RepID=UPI00301C2DF3
MEKEALGQLFYALTKHAAQDSFVDFLESWGITWEEYVSVRDYLKETYNARTYV